MTISKITYEYIIALGSNLGNRHDNINQAIGKMSALLGEITHKSTILETSPIGNADETFLNCAILLRTAISPHDTLKTLLKIEQDLGRVRTIHWGNRTIDLDIILAWKDECSLTINTNDLTLPHPEAFNRDFVVLPMSELLQKRFPFHGKTLVPG
jgi:GTP cyclohydrolase IA